MEPPIFAEESFYQRMGKIYEWDDRGTFIKIIKGRIMEKQGGRIILS
jgi:hypothetical protein